MALQGILRRLLPAGFSTILLFAASACTIYDGDTSVLVHTQPPGAKILVNGKDTGHTTPHMLDLGPYGSQNHVLSIEKAGFASESREVFYHSSLTSSRWMDGTTDTLFSWPMFWTMGDMFVPWEYRWVFYPHELHVRLYAAGNAPVQGDGQPATVAPAKTPEADTPGNPAGTPEPKPKGRD